MDEGRSTDIRRLKEEKEMEIQFEDLVVDEENDTITLSLQTENHDYGFQMVIPINDETDTPQKLRTFLEGTASSAIAEKHNYGEAHFDFNSCGYFYEQEETEDETEDEAEETKTYTEDELDDFNKEELTDIASNLDIYEEEMKDRSYTKAKIIEEILEAQE